MSTIRRIAFVVAMIIAFVCWMIAISLAVKGGFFENQLALQLMVLGGATSMAGAAVWQAW
jgi:membrane-bound metal-dependent hydrolase YbcI (DUF457 family)